MEDKYIATMLLHALGDTIGFKNGAWEFFPNNTPHGTLEKIYEFIDLGGINNINLDGWKVSDDTIFHMAIAKSLILADSNITFSQNHDLETMTIKQLIKASELISDLKKDGSDRFIGKAVEKHTQYLKKNMDWKKFSFDHLGGGNGAAMRNNCIGLAFWGEENREKLIDYAVHSSMMTHVNPIGWLGGVSTALFTAFIMESIHINRWVPLMLKIMEGDSIGKYIDKSDSNITDSFEQFIQCWKTYYDSRFVGDTPIKTKSHTNLTQRLIFYNNLFETNPISKMGFSGYSAVIVAYDCLLDAGDKWETLVFYSMINNFDSDTIGAIAGGLFGTMYGLHNIPHDNIKYIEFKDRLIKIGKLLYKKFFLREKLNI